MEFNIILALEEYLDSDKTIENLNKIEIFNLLCDYKKSNNYRKWLIENKIKNLVKGSEKKLIEVLQGIKEEAEEEKIRL